MRIVIWLLVGGLVSLFGALVSLVRIDSFGLPEAWGEPRGFELFTFGLDFSDQAPLLVSPYGEPGNLIGRYLRGFHAC